MEKALARRILQDMRGPGAVADAGGEIIYANSDFIEIFYQDNGKGWSEPRVEVLEALANLTGLQPQEDAEREVIVQRGKSYFRLSVYLLAKQANKEGLHLIIATPARGKNRPGQGCSGADDRRSAKLPPEFSALIGQEASFLQALVLAKKAAKTDLPVLLMGESGTGKEVLARTVHLASRRKRKSFVDVNCAAIPDSLVESELFGYEKGAFTGANPGGAKGYFENAHGGSIFMDEIGDAASTTQAKLLRVLQNGQFKRVGGNRNISVDVRLISATNQELDQRVSDGRFRKDLLYRINTITIHLPPLRERPGDLLLLVEHFLHQNHQDRSGLHFSSEATQVLLGYSWPGNVRELKGVVDYAVTMSNGPVITTDALPSFVQMETKPVARYPEAPAPQAPQAAEMQETDELNPVIREVEKAHIKRVLERSANRSDAIRRLGISRRTFYTKIRQYGLDRQDG